MASRAKRGSIRDFKADLAALDKSPDAHVLIFGGCEYLQKLALEKVRSRFETSHSLEAPTVDEEQLASLIDQPAFFEPASLYVLKRCEQARSLPKLVQALGDASSAHNRACFLYDGDAPPATLKTALNKAGVVTVACLEPWPNEVPPLVQEMGKRVGLDLRPDATALLINANGVDLIKLDNETRKLALILDGETGPFSAKDLAPHLGMLREDDAFELANLLLEGKLGKAQALASSLLDRGEKALALVGIIANHCRNAARIAAGTSLGRTPAELQTQIRLPPMIFKSYVKACYRQDPAPYARALERCREVDALLKSSRISEDLLLASVIDALA